MRRTREGQPLRFLLLLLGGWIMLRLLWPDSPLADVDTPFGLIASRPVARPAPSRVADLLTSSPAFAMSASQAPAALPTARRAARIFVFPGKFPPAAPLDPPVFSEPRDASTPHAPGRLPMPAALPPFATPAPHDRWAISGWLLWRQGSGAAASAPMGRLGGSQAGARLDFDLLPAASMRLSAYTRITTALDRPHAPEGAAGLAWQPSRAVPITLAAERRIALGEGARNATALFVAGGFGPTDIAPAIVVEGYAQAGMVGLRSRDGFVDGKTSVAWRLHDSGVRAGLALSGGAQPGLARLDIGPEVQLPITVADGALRLSAEWRQRIAGDAAPGSGLTLTLAASF